MNHRHTQFPANTRMAVLAGLATLAAALGTSVAQAQEPAVPTAPSASTTSSIDEAKLDKFVSAYAEVLKLQKEAADKQNAAKDPNSAQALATETQSKMTSAVKKNGLEIDEFNQIAEQMLQDEDLRARIAAKMQVRNSSGS